MNDTALKNFATNARATLMRDVLTQMRRWAIDAAGTVSATADVLNGRPLTPQQREQRRQLLERCAAAGEEALCEQVAYTWFNRFAAIRFMELHDYLPCRLRIFSAAEDAGKCSPQVLDEALSAGIEGVDRARVAELVQAGDPEALFRYLLLVQCNELAAALPAVFERVGSALELLLPERLLREGGVIWSMVCDLDVADWGKVEVLGWLYQFYNAELKDDFFSSKRKAAAADIAPATQLFTPEWIVRYMVENSLGRLWMLNRPESRLRERMEYYIEPDAEHEDFLSIDGPEDITFCDPACGSGHILSYAFELLFAMYEEAGYREREIPELILTKNLAGMEIDERAAQIASLVLALRAREHDRRFFGRGVQADVCVLESIPFEEGELSCCGKPLADALTHLGEVGSLLSPGDDDLEVLRAELSGCEGDLFSDAKADKLRRAMEKCEKLARRFDVVVANPPYMGSSKFNPFMSAWVKKNYPDVKSDLCTCFIERGFGLAKGRGYAAMVTMQSWMFLGSFEKMRGNVIANKGILAMAHLGPRAFDAIGGEVVSVTADVIYNGQLAGEGSYVRLVDVIGSEEKRLKLVEAIQNPDCGWFYRRDAQTFTQIPGTPIAYWASEGAMASFQNMKPAKTVASFKHGMSTGKNEAVLREWYEVGISTVCMGASSHDDFYATSKRYIPYNKGGFFRKWWGNQSCVLGYDKDYDELMDSFPGHRHDNKLLFFKSCISWSKISSGKLAMRFFPKGFSFDVAGCSCFLKDDCSSPNLLALFNSSVADSLMSFLSPTLNYEVGTLESTPTACQALQNESAAALSSNCVELSKSDWDSFETSWNFKRHPLL